MNPKANRPFREQSGDLGIYWAICVASEHAGPLLKARMRGMRSCLPQSLWTGRLTQRRRLAERKPARGYADKGKLSHEHNGKD